MPVSRKTPAITEQIRARLPLADYIRAAGVELRKEGSRLVGHCPFHNDRTPSFTLEPDRGTWSCWGTCALKGQDIFAFAMKRYGLGFKETVAKLAEEAGLKNDNGVISNKKEHKSRQIVSTYPYRDEAGELLFEVVRFSPKGFSQRRPDGNGGWIWNLASTRRVIYRLPQILKACLDQAVYVVEGEKDVHSLEALGLVATCNPQGAGKWQAEYSEHLVGRKVVILPDADPAGRAHASEVAKSLKDKAVSVRVLELPDLALKADVSDWLALGHTKEELLDLVDALGEWQPRAGDPALSPAEHDNGVITDRDGESPMAPALASLLKRSYRATSEGIVWHKADESIIQLTNFTARIVADVVCDNGTGELRHNFEVEAVLGKRRSVFTVPASQFQSMGWAIEHLGPGAIVLPGTSTRDHARTAIQILSGEIPEHHVYAHTGWRKVDGSWVYLHGGGAIGPQGPISGIEVALHPALAGFTFPPPTEEQLVSAVKASLALLGMAPDPIMVPILSAIYRAPLGPADMSLHLAGSTGLGKTQLAALAQQHFGAGMDPRHLPGAWSSTGNALEALAFTAKDALLIIDDFAPSGTASDIQRLHREAERIFRAQGNNAGRQRMRADASIKPAMPPRGLIISTGEDIPRTQSIKARLLIVEIGPDDVKWDRLTEAQRHATEGLYALAMAGYLQWLAGKYESLQQQIQSEVLELRQMAMGCGQHRRTPEMVANLAVGLRYLIAFATDLEAITRLEAQALWERCWKALGVAADAQGQHQTASEPTGRFLALLAGAISSGRAYLASLDGDSPCEPERWGWRKRILGVAPYERTEWDPHGSLIGWTDETNVYLEKETCYAACQALARDSGEGLALTITTMYKRLDEKGLLLSTEKETSRRLTIRKKIAGSRRHVLHLSAESIMPQKAAQAAQAAHEGTGTGSNGHSGGPLFGPLSVPPLAKAAQKSGPKDPLGTLKEASSGPHGPLSTTEEDPGADEAFPWDSEGDA